MKYKTGDRVVDDINRSEGIIIATDDRKDAFAKVKVKWDWFLKATSWEYEERLNKIITN